MLRLVARQPTRALHTRSMSIVSSLFGGQKSSDASSSSATTAAAAAAAAATTVSATNGDGSVSYIAALAAKTGPRRGPRLPIKTPTPHFNAQLTPNYTLPRAIKHREKLRKIFDRANLKPEFLPRWYLKAKQDAEKAAIAKATADAQKSAQPAPTAPAHQTHARTRIALRALLKNGPQSSHTLFAAIGGNFRSRTEFGATMRALVRQRWVRVDEGVPATKVAKTLAKATAAAAVSGGAAVQAAPRAAVGTASKKTYLFAVRNIQQACKILGEMPPPPGASKLKKEANIAQLKLKRAEWAVKAKAAKAVEAQAAAPAPQL